MTSKIGRNDCCPCGSRKKYKKCHGNITPLSSSVPVMDLGGRHHLMNGHYFQQKGANAEKIIHNLATKTFLMDWCYLNPKRPDGKELCDLLVVFDQVALIWQIKDLRVDEHGRYKSGEVEKNLRQLSGARRYLFELKKSLDLENPRRGKELFDPDSIKVVHLISVLMGNGEEPFPFVQAQKDHLVHVFTREFADIALSELDTVADFCEYLQKKESITPDKQLIVYGGEENLLARYLHAGRSFSWLEDCDIAIVDETAWPAFASKPEYRAKELADRISYGWDSIIDRAHEGSQRYERVARELARPNRFTRRVLSQSFYDASVESTNSGMPIMRRLTALDGTTYCFLFMDDFEEPRKDRLKMLELMCYVARGIRKENKKVIGIATGAKLRSTTAYDFCVSIREDWTAADEQLKIKIQKELGIFVNPQHTSTHEEEYPH